jgi:glycosyltransferase involved in cell wall biosynthesis
VATQDFAGMTQRNVMLMTRTLGDGGTERQLTEIAVKLDRARFHPHVGCVESEGFRADELRRAGVPIVQLPMTSLTNIQALRSAFRLRRYIREHRIDLIHAFDTGMNIFAIPTARVFGTPALSSQRCYEDTIWPLYRRPVHFAHRLADGVVANCEAMRRHLIENYSVPEKKIHVCYNGLDTEVFHPAAVARPEALREAELVIGTVCVLRPEKGLSTLIEAFAQVWAARPGLRLAIVGSGPEPGALETLARERGIADACLFSPSTNDVASWLHAIDIFVLPSLSEALSNSIMEAMACGCCTIASRVGGSPELIEDGVDGLLFEAGSAADLAEKLRVVLEDGELRKRLADRGASSIAQRFSIEASARRMAEIYGEILQ